jgi:hypothetical protein
VVALCDSEGTNPENQTIQACRLQAGGRF